MGRYSMIRKVLFNDWVNEGSQGYVPILSTITVISWNRGPYYADVDSVYSKMVLDAFL